MTVYHLIATLALITGHDCADAGRTAAAHGLDAGRATGVCRVTPHDHVLEQGGRPGARTVRVWTY